MERINSRTANLILGFFVIGTLVCPPSVAGEAKKGEVTQQTTRTLAGEERLSQSRELRGITEKLDELSDRLAVFENQKKVNGEGWWEWGWGKWRIGNVSIRIKTGIDNFPNITIGNSRSNLRTIILRSCA